MTVRAITDVRGIAVGHATDIEHLTGCTVVLCGPGALCGGAVLGGAPGTRETDALRPEHLVERVHGVLLAGGSAFGLAAADGVVRYLASRGIGFDTGAARVPIVPAAVLYDLAIGSAGARPDAAMGEAACRDAKCAPPAEGCVGAGTGATVGKLLGMAGAMKSGVGTWSVRVAGGATVGALVVANAFGDVRDAGTGAVLAGARDPATGAFVDTATRLPAAGRSPTWGRGGAARGKEHGDSPPEPGVPLANTTIGVVATDAALTKAQAARLAVTAHAGLARVVWPSHTSVDGDTFFVLSTGRAAADLLALEAAAANVVAEAVMRSVRTARTLGGVPGLAG